MLAAIGANPSLAGRFPSYYDPVAPSFFLRARPVLIHYRVAPGDQLEFLNLFFQRV